MDEKIILFNMTLETKTLSNIPANLRKMLMKWSKVSKNIDEIEAHGKYNEHHDTTYDDDSHSDWHNDYDR